MDNPCEFTIDFDGPQDTLYEDGKWILRCYLPDTYPFKSPSLGFINKLFHPNVDLKSGTICLDVINQTWSPMYELNNIFDVFLPQLQSYPNPSDPLNIEAANLLLKNEDLYKEKVKEYVKKYAKGQSTGQGSSKENFMSKNIMGHTFIGDKVSGEKVSSIVFSEGKKSKKPIHKVSTDIEDSGGDNYDIELVMDEEEMTEKLSNMSQLSDLSATSGIMDEECVV